MRHSARTPSVTLIPCVMSLSYRMVYGMQRRDATCHVTTAVAVLLPRYVEIRSAHSGESRGDLGTPTVPQMPCEIPVRAAAHLL